MDIKSMTIKEIETYLRERKKYCKCFILEQEEDKWGYGSAYCHDCGKYFGWYCPDSPDHRCYYYIYNTNEDGMYIILLNGNKHYLNDEQINRIKTYGFSSDWCIFCGEPEERK